MRGGEALTGQVSATEADWSRERRSGLAWAPGPALLSCIRDYQRHHARGGVGGRIGAKWAALRHRFWSVVTGADIPVNSRIGGGLLIPHPNGIVIHPMAEIGVNCLIFQQVTIGAARDGVPRLGGHVDIGAGAKLIGPISVGAHARVGANAVVTRDVPEGATVTGIPARVVERTADLATSNGNTDA